MYRHGTHTETAFCDATFNFLKTVDPNLTRMDVRMTRFYVLFNSISVISGRCLDDNERLRAMELRLRSRRFHLE